MITRGKMIGCLLLLWCAAPPITLENAVAQENSAAEEAPAASTQPTATEKPRFAGPSEQGFLLPNGWTLTPAGEHLQLNDLPLNIIALPDGEHVLVSTNGYNAHELSLVNLASKQVVSKQANFQSWFGLAVNAAADRVYWSGGGADLIYLYSLAKNKLEKSNVIDPTPDDDKDKPADMQFRAGLLLTPDGERLYSLNIDAGELTLFNLQSRTTERVGKLGGRPYDLCLTHNGARLYVSDWAGRQVLVVDPQSLMVVDKIGVGEHPNQLALHPKDDRLFVACASSNSVAVIDTRRGTLIETISTALFPQSPEGSTPDALVISPDGEKLYVANADNNCVAVVEIETPQQSAVEGFIPTGWYPTALAMTRDGKTLLVGVGKGNQTRPNPIDLEKAKQRPPAPGRNLPFPYIGTTLSGTLSFVPVPDEKQLATYTEQVYRNCPYSDKLMTAAPSDRPTAVPTKVGDPSPIKHVIYIIKENRTYDQVFGDIERGNGDPSLCMFPEEVTPNHHKLANEFVLLDNLYCNGQVSRDGHPWSTMAYNTDFVARDWMLTYSGRGGVDDDDEGNLSNAPSGYIWDACARAGLSYRSYGEYGKRVSQPDGSTRVEGRVPGLIGHMCPDYGIPKVAGQRARDTDNVETFLKEFREFEQNDNLPSFIVMSLGEDHTSGTATGAFTPQACVASNDLALGRLVEALSKSKYWPQIAIFVIEDDAQNGPDHVDAHRTVGLVIGPHVRRKHLDSTQYQTASMLRTIELILGMPPLSQFDAAANPMFESFNATADLTPYEHVPAKIDLNAVNTKVAYGAERSNKMDFSEYDRINDFELNEILWFAVMGRDAPMPGPVRRAIAFRPQR